LSAAEPFIERSRKKISSVMSGSRWAWLRKAMTRRPVIVSIVSRYLRSISRWKSWRISITRPGSPPSTIVRSCGVNPLRRTQTMQSSIA
jgi:hypothetical protein